MTTPRASTLTNPDTIKTEPTAAYQLKGSNGLPIGSNPVQVSTGATVGQIPLIGGAGNDTLSGHIGNDILNGGMGVDNLNGGSGADTFIFTVIDSSVGIGNRDIITDFDVSVVGEVMDLSAIAGGTLSFVGTKAFSAINQVRYEMDFVNSTTIVKLNLDNDPKTTEMEIELTGFKNLTADDFVLVKGV